MYREDPTYVKVILVSWTVLIFVIALTAGPLIAITVAGALVSGVATGRVSKEASKPEDYERSNYTRSDR